KESHRKDLASHPDPESCDGGREATGEALTGAHAGQPSSCEITVSGVPTLSTQAEGNTVGGATGKPPEDPAQSKTLRMRGNCVHGNREIPQAPVADGATRGGGGGSWRIPTPAVDQDHHGIGGEIGDGQIGETVVVEIADGNALRRERLGREVQGSLQGTVA